MRATSRWTYVATGGSPVGLGVQASRLYLRLLAALVVIGVLAAPSWAAEPGDVSRLTKALDASDQWVGEGPNGDKWRKYLATGALRQQIEKGASADPAIVARVLQQYRTKKNGLDLARFVAVRRGLESWLAALQGQYVDDLAKLAWASRGDYVPVDPADRLRPARDELRKQARALERTLGGNSQFALGWKKFLKWDLLEPHFDADVANNNQELQNLTAVLRRFRSYHDGLELPIFTRTADALEHYRALVAWYANVEKVGRRSRRKYRRHDLERAVYQQQLKDLEKFLTRHQEAPTDESARQVGRLLGLVEHLGQSDRLVAAVRSRITRPNVFAGVSASALNRLGSRPVSQRQPVREQILGARVRGSAVSQGVVSFRTIPADDHVEIEVQLVGDIRSSTVSYKKPVRVTSRGHTDYVSTKRLLITDERFVALPASTTACTNNHICSIKKTGGPLGRRLIERIARKKVAESKSKAQQIASRKSGQKVSAKFDREIAQAIYEARDGYDGKVRPPLMRVGMFPEQLRMSSTVGAVHFEATVATHRQVSTRRLPPGVIAGNDFAFQLHETSINNLAPSILAGIGLRQDSESEPPQVEGDIPVWLKNLGREQRKKHQGFLAPQQAAVPSIVGPVLAGPDGQISDDAPESAFKPWSFKLNDQHPVSVTLDDQKFTVRVRIAELTTVDNGAPEVRNDWDLLVTYDVVQEGNEIVLRREGDIEALPTGFDPQWFGDPRWDEKLTGEQVSVRRVLEKNINRRAEAGEGFPREVRIPAIDFKLPSGRQLRLDLAQLDCDNGWLTVGYRLP